MCRYGINSALKPIIGSRQLNQLVASKLSWNFTVLVGLLLPNDKNKGAILRMPFKDR